MAMKPNPRRQSAAQRGKAAAKKKSLADNSSGQRRVAVARKADPGSRGRKTTVIKGPKNSRVTPKIVESGVGNVPISLARLGLAIAKSSKLKPATGSKNKKTVTGWHGEEISRTKSAQKRNAQMKKDEKQVGKKYQKKGSINGLSLRSPSVTAKGFRGMGPVASRQTKPPIKYGKR
jgi:hypothetical protein